jgi:hypothetical protein
VAGLRKIAADMGYCSGRCPFAVTKDFDYLLKIDDVQSYLYAKYETFAGDFTPKKRKQRDSARTSALEAWAHVPAEL